MRSRAHPSLHIPPSSAFTGYRFPPDVITLAVRWYLRFGLSYRDVEELLAERGIEVDHVTVYRWVQRFAPEFAKAARARPTHRRGALARGRDLSEGRWPVGPTGATTGVWWNSTTSRRSSASRTSAKRSTSPTGSGTSLRSRGTHPDIYLAWGKVRLTVWTHKIRVVDVTDHASGTGPYFEATKK